MTPLEIVVLIVVVFAAGSAFGLLLLPDVIAWLYHVTLTAKRLLTGALIAAGVIAVLWVMVQYMHGQPVTPPRN
ncbi:MAG: hypothetical protein EPO06_11875 [Burkholderiaceae bacterium]|nr:MAG: hypothetical protein EPO06_11875 [Burkholderiaceae bacterium]